MFVLFKIVAVVFSQKSPLTARFVSKVILNMCNREMFLNLSTVTRVLSERRHFQSKCDFTYLTKEFMKEILVQPRHFIGLCYCFFLKFTA
jgi:hypothetical protein